MRLDPMEVFWGTHALLAVQPARPVASHGKQGRVFDAVYLSTRARPAYVEEVLSMAALAGEHVVILATSPQDVPDRLPESHDVTVELLGAGTNDPGFAGIPGAFPRTADPDWDLWRKRSHALERSRERGDSAILLLDDDVRTITPTVMQTLRGALSVAPVAGCVFEAQPDHSLVGHLIAATLADPGAPRRQYLGGGMLAVAPRRCRGYFLNLYNEDWLFIFANVSGAALCAGKVLQCERWLHFLPETFIAQEFGDLLAEGMRYLRSAHDIDGNGLPYWEAVVHARRSLLRDLILAVDAGKPRLDLEPRSVKSALEALADYLGTVSPGELLSAFAAVRAHYQAAP